MKGGIDAPRITSHTHWAIWGQHVAIAAAYAAMYEVVRHFTYTHWSPTTGLRLACLFLLPMRFWPALALGEALPTIENAWLCAEDLGIPWAISASVPLIVLFMGCVKPLRLRWTLYDDRHRVRMPMLLGATLGCAIISAVVLTLTLLTTMLRTPDAWPEISVTKTFWAYLLGHYLGGLTLTPIVLVLTERARQVANVTWALIWRSPLMRDVLLWAPVLGALVGLSLTTGDDATRQFARLGLLWPMLALGWRHGWHGTAIGGSGASIALAITGTDVVEPAVIQVQVILSLMLSGMLFIGSRRPRPASTAVPIQPS